MHIKPQLPIENVFKTKESWPIFFLQMDEHIQLVKSANAEPEQQAACCNYLKQPDYFQKKKKKNLVLKSHTTIDKK